MNRRDLMTLMGGGGSRLAAGSARIVASANPRTGGHGSLPGTKQMIFC
jgi:hypothetical protein